MGSRFIWEINNWQYPSDETSGKAQKDDPDDHSADGADMMAMIRYLVMFWWGRDKTGSRRSRSSARTNTQASTTSGDSC